MQPKAARSPGGEVLVQTVFRRMLLVGPVLILLLAATAAEAAEATEAQLRARLAGASGAARVDILNELSKSQRGVSSDETIRRADQAIALAHSIAYPAGEACGLRYKAIGYWY